MPQFKKKLLKLQSRDFSAWYQDVILKAELADYSPVKGCMVIRPYGYALWENIQRELDLMFKSRGVQNAYFPIFIPYSFLKKEKQHVKGFSPELAIVTHGGGKKLEEELVVRPTSETIMYAMYAKWIHSHRDLPLLINQWNNVVRWEKRTYLFLRTMEFLWQEGHTAHATHQEAVDQVNTAADDYRRLYEQYFALPVLVGRKSESEKFAGAHTTIGVESLCLDGKMLQAATSHDLGQNFSRVFDIQFQDQQSQLQYVWQTSWGLSTRSIGGLIMAHGDDQGLKMPPNIAPIQVVIVPIKTSKLVLAYCERVREKLTGRPSHSVSTRGSRHPELVSGSKNIPGQARNDSSFVSHHNLRVHLDDHEEDTPGFKFNYWELKGVPLRIEVGEREVKEKIVTFVRRDTGQKSVVKFNALASGISKTLNQIQQALFNAAQKFQHQSIHEVGDFKTFTQQLAKHRGLYLVNWCQTPECELQIKEATKATTRVISDQKPDGKKVCFHCGKEAKAKWFFARAY
jgi:prolyl-tRNA synthetase